MCWLKLFKSGLEKPPTLEAYDSYARQQVGDVPRYESTWAEVKAGLQSLEVRCMIKDEDVTDLRVFHTDEATLARMIPFLTYPADYYVAELDIDCDDYSMWAASDARRIFKVNGVYQVWGWMPLGYHAWSLGIVGQGRYKLWEPNAGFESAGDLFKAGEYGYNPEKWK